MERKNESVTLTSMCMIVEPSTGEVLVQKRTKNWLGCAFPGGHLEPGESVVDSVIREVREETGLTVRNLRLCGIKDWVDPAANERYLVFLFRTECYSGILQETCEEGHHFWIKPEQLHGCELAEGFSYMLEIFQNDSLSEDFIAEQDGVWQHKLQ